jgi:CSLREA domain-containing protein
MARIRTLGTALAPALLCAALWAANASAATFTVTDDADTAGVSCGADCTLRQAITAANASADADDNIRFAITQGGGDGIITVGSALPAISAPLVIDGTDANFGQVTIDGSAVGGSVDGLATNGAGARTIKHIAVDGFGRYGVNVTAGTVTFDNASFSNNSSDGIRLATSGNTVQSTSVSGSFEGIEINALGLPVTETLTGNTITGNGGNGVFLGDTASGGTIAGTIDGNTIDGNGPSGGNGIVLNKGAGPGLLNVTNNQILNSGDAGIVTTGGDGATISGNSITGNGGVGVNLAFGFHYTVVDNSITGNGSLGIDLPGPGVTANDPGDGDPGTNGKQNFPVITSASRRGGSSIVGTLNTNPGSANVRIDFYANSTCDASGYGEGETHLGSTTVATDASGNAAFNVSVSDIAHNQPQLTATATSASGDTSEFSACFAVSPPPATDPSALAQAMLGDAGLVTGASYVTTPPGIPGGSPVAAVIGAPTAGFPRSGSDFAFLTTGMSDGSKNDTTADGGHVRGDSDFDVTILKVDVNVPAGANCLQFDTRFGTDESPGTYNDGFIAELDNSDWSASGAKIDAPHNFAFDENGQVLSVNGVGDAAETTDQAQGTPYRVATKALRASTPVTPGPHSVYFSVFDLGDAIVDSGAAVDNLAARALPPSQCKPGVLDVNTQFVPPPPPPSPVPGPLTIEQLPPPTMGVSVNSAPESGRVLIKLPPGTTAKRAKTLGLQGAATGFVPLDRPRQIPIGSTLDTSAGKVRLLTAAGTGKPLQDGHFNGGRFGVGQLRKNPLTTLSMSGGSLDRCGAKLPKGGSRKVAAARSRPGRRLFSSVKGRFRTRGRNSSATVRGTQWEMRDGCSGTLSVVTQGVVAVRDFTLRKTKVVKAGQRYLAKPPKKRRRR